MPPQILRLIALLSLFAAATPCRATGYFGPTDYLGGGGRNVVATPEFYWDLEVKRMARDFHPLEKPMVVARSFDSNGLVDTAPMRKATADADGNDFADALRTGAIKPPDPVLAKQQHDNARTALASNPIPAPGAEFDSEFADYHRGAYAYAQSAAHYDEAKKAWQALLNRPVAERHYRSVWAAFMLGKLAMKAGDPEAGKWFEQTRDLARQGFADSLGMAADSYGWEGRAEWKQNHPEKAAPLFLTQLALGDESAVVSLKALVPDRVSIDGMLNYGPEPGEGGQTDNSVGLPAEGETLAALKIAAADPLLRRLVTVHVLTTGWGERWPEFDLAHGVARSATWLKIIDEVKPTEVEDGEYLGWLAYMAGSYDEAQRWLKVSKSTSAAASWLRAKLQMRAGNTATAAKSLAAALDTLRSRDLYTGWSPGAYKDASQNGPRYLTDSDGPSWTLAQGASGDLALMHLEMADFDQAMDLLLKAGIWSDAAFIAERLLTANELKAYVDKLPLAKQPTPAVPGQTDQAYDPDSNSPGSYTAQLRNLLGRRLVREDRCTEAVTYLQTPYDKIVQLYRGALKEGANRKLSREKRARALFHAAWLARFDGLELMGTEVAPDNFASEGSFEATDIAKERLDGTYTDSFYLNGKDVTAVKKNLLPASKKEISRIKENVIEPDKRFHYRFVAAVLAMRAAALLPDNSEELADVVNSAGKWIKDRDEKLGNTYFQVIDRRCSKSELGGKASAAHWFVDESGPWSNEELLAYSAMHKPYNDGKAAEQ